MRFTFPPYDQDGKLTQHIRHIDGHAFTTAYIYDARTGRLKEKHLPDQQILNYHNHSNGKLQAITRNDFIGRTTIVGELNTEADSLSHKQRIFGNGIASSYDYDNNGRLTKLSTSRVQQLSYSYDEQGNITGIERKTDTESYTYDTLSRLTQATTSVGSFEYRYDKLGNRTGKTENGQKTNYRYSPEGQGNRLDALETKNSEEDALSYNASGSPVQSGNKTYQYNAEQRPVKLLIDGKLKAEYAYNGWGERIKKTVYSGNQKKVTYYFYDGNSLTGEAEQDGKITAQYVYYNNQPVAKLEGKNLYAIHTDHLGTPQAATDEDGELVWKAQYTPFGKATVTTDKITLNLRFPGQYKDAESGMHYNYFRDYDPEVGRYLTSDPIGLKGGLNTFAYVGGNPLNGSDPLGLLLNTNAPTPGIPFKEALARTGLLTTRGGFLIGGVAAASYLSGWLLAAGYDVVFGIEYVEQPEIGNYNNILNEIQKYKPSYSEANNLAPSWDDYYARLGKLDEIQQQYVADTGECDADFSQDLFDRAQADIAFREGINSQLSSNNTAIEEHVKQAYEDYKANGGDLAYDDWVSQGMPEALDSLPEGYFNPGHHDPSNTGQNPYNSTKAVLPANHQELWNNSVPDPDDPETRWTKVGSGRKAVYHRFQSSNDGTWHWNGSTDGATKNGTPRVISINHVPKEIKRM